MFSPVIYCGVPTYDIRNAHDAIRKILLSAAEGSGKFRTNSQRRPFILSQELDQDLGSRAVQKSAHLRAPTHAFYAKVTTPQPDKHL
jgi:hypothetical protein